PQRMGRPRHGAGDADWYSRPAPGFLAANGNGRHRHGRANSLWFNCPSGFWHCYGSNRRDAKRILITRPPSPSEKVTNTRTAYPKSDDEVVEMINKFRKFAEDRREPRPSVFVIVDMEPLAEKMRVAHDEWERRRETSGRRVG